MDPDRQQTALRIALVGCGRIARVLHGPILARLPGVRVVAAVDPDDEARRAMSQILPGAVLHAGLDSALAAGDVEAVVICTPPTHHAGPALAALAAGLPVYVEKPLAADPAQAAELIAARDRAGVPAMVGHNFRFHPAFEAVRSRLAAGEYGTLLAFRSVFASERRDLPSWKLVPGGGGDAMADLGAHHLDLYAHISGARVTEESVSGQIHRTPTGSVATLVATLETGQPVSLTASQLSGASAHRMELLCSEGHVEIDMMDGAVPRLVRAPARLGRAARLRARGQRVIRSLDIRARPDPSFRLALAHFAALAARGGADIGSQACEFEDGLRAMRLSARAVGS